MKRLALGYGQFLSQHRGQPPRDEKDLKSFLSATPERLKALQVTNVDSLFVSERDKKPYVVIYGSGGSGAMPGGMTIIGYEQEGVEGKRFVANSLGAVEEADEARFRQLVPSAK